MRFCFNYGKRLFRSVETFRSQFQKTFHQNRGSNISRTPKKKDPDVPSARVLIKPFFFTVGFSGLCFVSASIWQYENIRSAYRSRSQLEFFSSYSQRAKYGHLRKELNRIWNSLSPGERVFVPLLCLNVAVTLLWQIKSINSTIMLKYFTSNPSSSTTCLPLLLSAFSHHSFVHLAVNMYVLHSFSGAIVNVLGKEQFLGLYLSAGVISSFASLVHKVILKKPGSSLGASGCICAVLGLFGSLMPNSPMQIVFLPGFAFTASSAIKGIIAVDSIGILAGWTFFDHAAHLGGTLFGVWWANYGGRLIWQKRETVINWWHENVRNK